MLYNLIISFAMVSFTVGSTLRAATQPHAVPAPEANVAAIHSPRSIDQELDHLTKALQLTSLQRKEIRPLLQEHHDKIQALLDKNATLSRAALQSQIHAISDDTHHRIEALLTQHQKQLAKAMQRRMRREQQNHPPVPSVDPATVRASQAKTIWTNEDLERLSKIPGLISVVGQPLDESGQNEAEQGEFERDVNAPGPQSEEEDPAWYAQQAAQLQEQLESQQADLRDYTKALENVREFGTPAGGLNFDIDNIGITPDSTIDILQNRISETQSELDDLEDLARRNNIPPGVLRGQW